MTSCLHSCLHIATVALGVSLATTAATTAAAPKPDFGGRMDALEKKITATVPQLSPAAQAQYDAAREAALQANQDIDAAEKQLAKLKSARGLVGHAKNKWIREAKQGLEKARQALAAAETPADREAAEQQSKKWQANLEAGRKALAERQARLDAALATQEQDEQALRQAQNRLAAARTQMLQVIEQAKLKDFLASDSLDETLTAYVIMKQAGVDQLTDYAQRGEAETALLDSLFSQPELQRQMLVADGAADGRYPRAMEILREIQQTHDKSRQGVLQRLAVAIALEHATPRKLRPAVADTEADVFVDPVNRYAAYEKAYLAGHLDPQFDHLTSWDLRMVVDGEEPDAIAAWGREMLRNYRPDHCTTSDYRWRYVALVRTDIRYGSQDNQYDEDRLQFFQNILKNGGVCGRRAFIGRFILRAFGIPTTARPQRGHGALVHWTPDGWVPCLGADWGSGWTKTRYGTDVDFLATTQARATGDSFLMVKRAQWIGDAFGERPVYGLHGRHKPGFWYGVSLQLQQDLIADAANLGAVGKDIAEANVTKEAIEIAQVSLDEADRQIRTTPDHHILIPAAATTEPTHSTRQILFMESVLGGKQLHYSRNGGSPSFHYTVHTDRPGTYHLRARVVTPSWQQNLDVTVNDQSPVRLPLPFTVGMWEMTDPVAVHLKAGANTLKFTRHSDGHAKGFSIKEFVLQPVDSASE